MSSISVTPNLYFMIHYTLKNCIVATFFKKITCIVASYVV
nr:MAG TPA: hypothetical protein [Caudoviricetes sp.]DAP41826.1 MAG TPA: hypothetical protein [Caudoviricetes sp.]